MMKYLLSVLLIGAALIAGSVLIPARAMAPTQFGEFTEGYLKRKAERAEKRKMRPVTVDPRCDGSERYQLKSEAYAAGRPDPCVAGAKEWVK